MVAPAGDARLAPNVRLEALFQLQAQILDHGLRDRVDRLDGGQQGLANLPHGEKHRALHALRGKDPGELRGLNRMSDLAQTFGKGASLAFEIMQHGIIMLAGKAGGIDADQTGRTGHDGRATPAMARAGVLPRRAGAGLISRGCGRAVAQFRHELVELGLVLGKPQPLQIRGKLLLLVFQPT